MIYLIVPEHKIRYFSVILNLFYSACFEHCLSHWDERSPERTHVCCRSRSSSTSSATSGGSTTSRRLITTLRKRRCSVSLILQEKAQLEALYGRLDAQTIFSGGCGNKLFFPGLDQETCEYLERALGQNTVYDTYYAGVSEHARVMGKPLLRADEIRMLPTVRRSCSAATNGRCCLRCRPTTGCRSCRCKAPCRPFPCPGDPPANSPICRSRRRKRPASKPP